MEREIKLLGEKVISHNGCLEQVELYYEGEHPEMGSQFNPAKLVLPKQGWSGGWETVVEIERFPIISTVRVNGTNGNGNGSNGNNENGHK